ncbi:hypothetical protein [Bacteroides sp.]
METKTAIIKELTTINNINDCNYSIELRKLAQKYYQQEKKEFPIELFSKIIEDTSLALFIRFNAYYTVLIYYRRHEKKKAFCEYVNRYYAEIFEGKGYNESTPVNPYCYVISSLYHLYISDRNNSHIIAALKEAKKTLEYLKNNTGVCQTYADIYATALEYGRRFSEDENQFALDLIDKAILLKPEYAKYYCTKGRIKFYLGFHEESIQLIEKAIELEDKTKSDSIFRVSQYYYYLLDLKGKLIDLKAEKNSNEINQTLENYKQTMKITLDDYKNNIENIKSKYLEFLAFFAAILAFIISSIQVVQKTTDFREAATLILILVGGLNISFSLFRLLMDHNNDKKTYITTGIILIVSVAIITLMFVLH